MKTLPEPSPGLKTGGFGGRLRGVRRLSRRPFGLRHNIPPVTAHKPPSTCDPVWRQRFELHRGGAQALAAFHHQKLPDALTSNAGLALVEPYSKHL